ncbi:MAG: hypothetical protein SOX86_04155 [Bacilli bacterium]|nr:hypothetical protein [Bacilli bacterium]
MKNIDKKRKVQLFIIFMITIALLAGSVSYALIELNIIYRGNQENTISSCSFNIDIKENNPINLVSTYPMDDNEATKLEPYKFSITPNSQTCSKLQYNITIVSNCDTCTKTNGICNDNNLCNCNEGYQIDPNLIKYEITNKTTGEKTVGINPYKMGVAGSMTVGTTINFELRMWIINSATNDDLYIKENGSYKEDSNGLILTKNFCSKVKITGTDTPYLTPIDVSGANAPVLASNMIPVYYDETAETWKKADIKNGKTNPWYSYNKAGEYKGMWANAVTVKEENRQTYLNAEPGTPISMDDINTMWVWIPRFKVNTTDFGAISGECSCKDPFYTTKKECENNYYSWNCPNPGAIDVTFVKENETAIDAFTFGTKELSGFWYGKFETSHTTLASSETDNNLGCANERCSNANGIIIKPNVTSLRYNNVSNFFYASRSMEQSGNSFGFVSTEVDTHMSKNSEWGAVAYLTQSIYGRCTNSTTCTEVYINNSSGYYTGRSGDTPSDSNYTYAGTYEYNQNKVESTIVEGTGTNITPTITNDTTYPWTNNNGVYSSGNKEKASTTSTLTYTFTLTDKGVVSFDYSVSSEKSYDKMKYIINKDSTTVITGIEISGTSRGTTESSLQYENKVHVLEKGTYTLVFTYSKDGSGNNGLDKGYVKNVKILNGVQTIDKVLPGGKNASTTGTIYGIYDMNGGAYETVMGVLADTNGKPISGRDSSSNSGFTGMLIDGTTYTGVSFPDSKYYNLYTGSSYTGHALTETKNWYSDIATFVLPEVSWFERGEYYGISTRAGVFSFSTSGGHSYSNFSSRLVISNK